MSNKKFRLPAGPADDGNNRRRIAAALAREHALIAIDHLYRAQACAKDAQGTIKPATPTHNSIILDFSTECWKVMVTTFMQAGIISAGDIGRYGIPAADRRPPVQSGNGSGSAPKGPVLLKTEEVEGEVEDESAEETDRETDQPEQADAGPEQRPET